MIDLIKLIFLGIVGVFVALSLKGEKIHYAMYIGILIGVFIFSYSINILKNIVGQLKVISDSMGEYSSYAGVLIRVVGMTYICEFGAGICRDAGFIALSDQIEIIGKISVMAAGMPILFAVIQQITGLV